MHSESIAILDYGSQYTQLLARRVRELGVFSRILPCDTSLAELKKLSLSGLILSGGPAVTEVGAEEEEKRHEFNPDWLELGVPALGICYGMQAMAYSLGGQIRRGDKAQFGAGSLSVQPASSLLGHLAVREHQEFNLDVWLSHIDQVVALPPGFAVVGRTDTCPIAAIEDPERRLFGLQFHPEVVHTPRGPEILAHFLRAICGCKDRWDPSETIAERVATIREQVGTDRVILGLSGGVDSSVAALLLNRAIGDQLQSVFVNNGLLRKGEEEQVLQTMKDAGVRVTYVDASKTFLRNLSTTQDPERKRMIIGATFVDVFESEAQKVENTNWLAQGTIYPDVIESSSKDKKAHTIKSHHNVGGLPDYMNMKLVEPLRDLFKDEVRILGRALGLPQKMVGRHPFPGPGLAVRVLGEVKPECLDILREADAIFLQVLRDTGWYDKVSQAFAVFLPVRSTGVVGDRRRYAHVIALRAVTTPDFMTAQAADLPRALLDDIAGKIVNSIPEVGRVVYDITSKPPATIEWE